MGTWFNKISAFEDRIWAFIFRPLIKARTLFLLLVFAAFIYNLIAQLWIGVILCLIAFYGIACQAEEDHPSH